MQSKYIGKVYNGFKVVNYYVNNTYKKAYKNSKLIEHRAYNYELYNEETLQHLTLSGNQLRLIDKGIKDLDVMLHQTTFGGKNVKINAYRKWLKNKQD